MLIKGKWMWNNEIWDKDENGGFQSQCEFVSNGQVFTDLGFGYNSRWDYYTLDYWEKNTGSMQVAASAQGDTTLRLELEEYRIMDFGEAGCEISMDAYDFIVANAEPFYDIADKLSRIWDNVSLVHNAGRKSGYDAGNQAGYTQGYSNGKQDGYFEGEQAGKQAEYDAFWDAYQDNGKASRDYEYAFRDGFNDENFKPKYDFHIKGNYSGSGMFSRSKITDIVACLNRQGVVWECSQALRLDSTFQQAQTKTVPIIDASVLTRLQTTFNGATNLQEIVINNLQASCTFSTAFNNCSALITVSITGEIGNDINFQWSTKLTRASIESIVNHLSDNSGGNSVKTLTLSKTAVDREFEGISAADFTTIVPGSSSLDWFDLDISARMKNWTITLV